MSQVFDGTSSVTYNTTLPVTAKPFTLAAWVKPTNLTNHTHQCPLGIGYDDGTGSSDLSAPFLYWNGSAFKWAIYLSGGGFTAASTGPTSGTWYHVCLTVDSGGNATLYVNGASVATKTGAKTPTAGISRGSSIHNSSVTAFASPFGGEIAEEATYNVALTSAEASTLAGYPRGGGGAVAVEPGALQEYEGLCNSGDHGDNFWIPWSGETDVGVGWNAACVGDPTGCGRASLPKKLWFQASDWHTGPCTAVNQAMPWIDGQQKWMTKCNTGTCTYYFNMTASGNSFTLKIYTAAQWPNGTPLETITSTATTCNPLVVSFLPTGTEFGSCGCNSFGGFTVQENQA